MITQFITIASATLGLLLAVGDSPVAKPTCCIKRAYCCSVKQPCCGSAKTVEKTVATLTADAKDDLAKPTCCIKRAYCCSAKQSCCPKRSGAKATTGEVGKIVRPTYLCQARP